ncbi:hypothetical protein Q3G72_003121 [Acer saccharum]|nr:hypothetical protein Q3G72_003121 [Acer saccharum]
MNSIESFTDFGSLYEYSIDRSESSMQEEGYGSLFEDDHLMCIARNAPNNARYVFAQHDAGRFLHGYLLGVLPKGLQGTKNRSSEAGEVHCSKRVEFMGFRVP